MTLLREEAPPPLGAGGAGGSKPIDGLVKMSSIDFDEIKNYLCAPQKIPQCPIP